MRGVDYSFGRPNPAAIRQAGFGFVARYLSRTPAKNITPVEAQALLEAGLDIVLVWETTAQRVLDGAAAGATDGRMAAAMALAIGAPLSCGIYWAVDFAAQPGQYGPIGEYRDAFAAAASPHPEGPYGPAGVIDEMKRRGSRLGWQAGATSWSGGRTTPQANIVQHGSVTVDGCEVDVNDTASDWWGGWRQSPLVPPGPQPGPVPPPTPAPTPPSPEDDEMPRAFKAIDPATQHAWFCRVLDGAVYLPPGSAAPYLGALNTHPEWNAVRADDPVVEFAAWQDGSGWGYVIVTQDAADGQTLHFYTFPRDGSARGNA